MTLGSLFDGIGGFPLAASRFGITPVWASDEVLDERATVSAAMCRTGNRHFEDEEARDE